MSYESERADIESLFSAQWGSTTAICYGNVAFNPDSYAEWVRISLISGSSQEQTIGTPSQPFYRHQGLVVVSIFTPLGAGESRGRVLAQQVTDIFKSRHLNNIRFRSPYLTNIGPAGSYHQFNVNAPFVRDELS